MSEIATAILRRPDQSHPRYAVLGELSDEQYFLYLTVLSVDGYFTPEQLSLEEDQELVSENPDPPVAALQEGLECLAAVGLIEAVTVPVPTDEGRYLYMPVYRRLPPEDEPSDAEEQVEDTPA
jgi:hypothetical protein